MQLTNLKSKTNGNRHQLNIKKALLSRTSRIIKTLCVGLKKRSGRSSQTGHITVRHKGGGCKKTLKLLFNKTEPYIAILLIILYDSTKTAFTSLNFNFSKKVFFQSLATEGVVPGSIICCTSIQVDVKLGYRLSLKLIPSGALLHSVSKEKDTLYLFARAAGTYCQIIQKNISQCKIKLPSGQIKSIPIEAFGTVGVVANGQHNLIVLGKAGRNRLKNKRPSVRGIAMNPVDHPHGGRSNGGKPSVTPWGIPTKGQPTVKKKPL